jgi:nicotinamide-nucleotide amidase
MIAELADSEHRDIAVAESLTGGIVASRLAAAPRSSRWFRGGVVAYASDVKHELLNVPPGPVVSAQAARAMAEAVRQLLKADVAVALTGAAGPDGQDGQPPGTVFLGLSDETGTHIEHHCFERNDPLEVCAEAVARALRLLYTHLNNGPGSAVAR